MICLEVSSEVFGCKEKNHWVKLINRWKEMASIESIFTYSYLHLLHLWWLQVLSRPSGFFLKPIANIFPNHVGGASLLSFNKKDVIWVLTSLSSAYNFTSTRFSMARNGQGRLEKVLKVKKCRFNAFSLEKIPFFFHRFARRLRMQLNFLSILLSLAMSVSFFLPYHMVKMIRHIHRKLM